jgi:pyruvate dehydrogenase E2 component (dihydrolipoamide acetyltransferase)
MQDQVVPQEEQDDGFIPIMKRPLEKPELPAEAECFPAMPNSKRLAKELGVNLGTVKPANGMYITRQDVLAAAKDRPHDALGYTVMPMGRMRKAIARRMLESVSTIPSFQVTISVDARQLLDLKKQLEVLRQTKVSYNDIITKALSVVAKDFPLINARYEHDEIRVYEHTNVGLAVAIEDGLIVPVIRNVDMLSIQDIAKTSRALIEKARKGALLADEMGSGSVTISNLGMYGVDHFTAIVNPPESAIFAIGSIEMKPVWDGSGFKPVEMMTITGSFDHRIIDGAYAARLLNALQTLLEHPVMMFT